MRYHALACDYDGTIAEHGRVDEQTVAALQRLKASGRRLILVTGRDLEDLAAAAPDLTLFARIVAENGAVLHDPRARDTRELAPPPAEALVRDLTARGVTPLSVGRCIVSTWEPNQTAVLEAIRNLGLELNVIFNKGAVMVLPSGINKATGLAAALADLALSPHNAVGIGDAENDHAFLSACECSVAVASALPSLKERVDLVTRGDRGAGVIELIDRLLTDDLAELERALSRRLFTLGHAVDDRPLTIRPYGESVLIAGPSGVGKSTITRALIEQISRCGYQFCVIDPEGDYQDLEGAVSLSGPDERTLVDEATQLLASVSQNVVLNLMDIRVEDRPPFFQRVLPVIQQFYARHGRPHWLIVDEAHHMLPADWQPVGQFVPASLGSILMITVHPEHLAPKVREQIRTLAALGGDVRTEAEAFAAGRSDLDVAAPPPPGKPGRWACVFRPGEPPCWIRVPEAQEERQRHRRKYAEGELGRDKSFYFRGPDDRLKLRAHNLAMFSQVAEGIDDETWLYHLRRGDYSQWFRNSIKDEELAAIAERIEQDESPSAAASRHRIREAIEERYTTSA
ncbi:MAG TPA: HAD-IIB family hydrolase [Vicinamibacterales bacterium]|nr:HAD-IIB family hydrolase [Vicinamibacterales bacterium]